MLFNSYSFALFFPVVYALYWFVINKNYKNQNLLLLFASYFFYASWDYRFLFLLMFSTLLDYFTGIKMYQTKIHLHKRIWFWTSISINLGFLGIFKYYNFFANSFVEMFQVFGYNLDVRMLNIVLPVGISFYTFHGLSYVIDIYKDRIKPVFNIVEYSVFVSYFPLLVAGPIERSTHLLPQIQKKRVFDYAKSADGLRQILWGLFKKIVIADNCGEIVNQIFNNSDQYQGSTFLLGAILFSFQIYCDFSAYSDIALGVSRLLGIELLRNFAFPYFSRDIAEFWRRWHISLTTWFRDYLYIPLGGSKGSLGIKIRNTFIVFLISGFWHGANWTFLMWGFLNALFFIPLLVLNKNRNYLEIVAQGKLFPNFKELLSMATTFLLTTLAWIFFRSESIGQAFKILKSIFSSHLISVPEVLPKMLFILIGIFILIEWLGRESHHALQSIALKANPIVRYSFYYLIVLIIFVFAGKEQQFIYFEF